MSNSRATAQAKETLWLWASLRRLWQGFFAWFANLYYAHLPSYVWKQFRHNQLLQVASALSYQTVLSLVPLLVVGFSLLNAFDRQEGQSTKLLSYVLQSVIPIEPEKIGAFLKDMPSLADPSTVGTVGVLTLLLLSTTLLSNIEKALNQLWRVRTQRPIISRFANYYALLTLTPVLFSIGFYKATQITEASGTAARLMPTVLTYIVFFVCYKILPVPKTRWRPTLFGALVANFLFDVSKSTFWLYVNLAAKSTYTNIYGTLAIVPLFLIWVYISWIIFLLGAQIAYSVQNLTLLAELERQQDPARRSEELFDQATDEAAIRLFAAVSEAFVKSEPPPDEERLAISLPMPALAVHFLVERFVQRGFLHVTQQGGLLPARPPASISVLSLLDALHAQSNTAPLRTERLRIAVEKLRESRVSVLEEMYFSALLSEETQEIKEQDT